MCVVSECYLFVAVNCVKGYDLAIRLVRVKPPN